MPCSLLNLRRRDRRFNLKVQILETIESSSPIFCCTTNVVKLEGFFGLNWVGKIIGVKSRKLYYFQKNYQSRFFFSLAALDRTPLLITTLQQECARAFYPEMKVGE